MKSTLAVEALAYWDKCDAAYLVFELAKEADILDQNGKYHTWTDNQYLYDTINIKKQVSDNYLHVEKSSL